MKKTYIRKVVADLFQEMDKNGFKKCDVMELTLKTCVDKNATVFVNVTAVINEPGKDGKTFKIEKDYDL